MKKILVAITAFVCMASLSVAQDKKGTKAKPAVHAAVVVKPAVKPVGPLKKDGTADMRFKENKAKPAGPLKKDGTADMRFKANKPAVKKKG